MADAPHLGKFQPGPATGLVLYALLAAALGVGLLGDRLGFLPPTARSLAPLAFGLFLLLFAIYRFMLVRAGRSSFGKALFQVGAGVLFVAVLLARGPAASEAAASDLPTLLDSNDATVRRLACELARYRPDGDTALEHVRAHAAHDPVPRVADECARSLARLESR
jgi:hypothetical protein